MPAPTDLLDALDPEQRRVAEALRGPVRVLAGAGTGKTRAITHRIAYGVATGLYVPTEVLAVTFTTRAAGEMRGRLRGLGAGGVQARTFHSAALRQLRYFWPRVHGHDLPNLIESKIGLLAQAARRQRVNADQALLRDLASEIEWAKVSNVGPDDYARVAPARDRSVSSARPRDRRPGLRGLRGGQARRRAGWTWRTCCSSPPGCSPRRRRSPRRCVGSTSGSSWTSSRTSRRCSRPCSTCGWAVATSSAWSGTRPRRSTPSPAPTPPTCATSPPSSPTPRRIELVRNYRSTPEVVAAANHLLAGTPSKGVDLVAQRPSGSPVRYTAHADEVAEAAAAADRIAALRAAGTPAGEMAVLFRINAQSETFEDALTSRGRPVRRPRRGPLLRPRRGAPGGDPAARHRARRPGGRHRPGAGAGHPVRDGLVRRGARHAAARPATGGSRCRRWSTRPPSSPPRCRPPTLGDFVDDLDRRAAEQHAPLADGVTLATLHAAKGLEWDAVFLCGLQDGTLPITYADTPAAVEEERRLLYVGMTRARRELSISWALARNPGGRASRKPSRFLDEVAEVGRAAAAGAPTRRNRKAMHCRECGTALSTPAEKKLGRCVDCPASYDEALFERLREWRLERAGDDKVPAYVVFTDATLQLIAEHRPTDEGALRRISGVGPSKLAKYGEDVLALTTARNLEEIPIKSFAHYTG